MKKLLVLALAGIMSMAVLGVGYALWFDTLNIKGTVKTGTLGLALSDSGVVQDEDTEISGADGPDADTTVESKDIGRCSQLLSGDLKTMTMTVDNAYPSFDCWFKVDIKSTGSIPVHVTAPVAVALAAGEVPVPGGVEVSCTWDGQRYVQLHANEVAYCTFHTHLSNEELKTLPNQGQGATFTFSYLITGGQYNEYPAP